MLFKAYFDGGNDPNNPDDHWVTLSGIFSDRYSLKTFALDWSSILRKHSADYLHTTDAVRKRQHHFLWDCMRVIEDHVVRDNTFRGIIPATVTIDAKEFRIVRDQIPDGPQILSEALAAQGLNRIIMGAREIARRKEEDDRRVFYELFYDRGEPYRGHIEDRMRNPEFRRTTLNLDGIDVDRYISINRPLDSKEYPELQAADLFSWCYNHRHCIEYEWQYRMMDIPSDSVLLDRKALTKPDWAAVKFINSLGLPSRARR
jgi:hypothetical protein